MLQVLYKVQIPILTIQKKLIKAMMYVNIISKDNDLEIKLGIIKRSQRMDICKRDSQEIKVVNFLIITIGKDLKPIYQQAGYNTSKFEEQVRVVLRNMPD